MSEWTRLSDVNVCWVILTTVEKCEREKMKQGDQRPIEMIQENQYWELGITGIRSGQNQENTVSFMKIYTF